MSHSAKRFKLRELVDVVDGEWFPVRHKNYRLVCCDCGLVHRTQFRIVAGRHAGADVFQLHMRVWRDPKTTRAWRARMEKEDEMAKKKGKLPNKAAVTRAHKLGRQVAKKAGRKKATSKDYAVGMIIEKRHIAKQRRKKR
jgi:hypothetical protein